MKFNFNLNTWETKWILAGLFILAFIVRYFIASPGFDLHELGGAYTADSPRYERLGLTLLQEGVFEAHPLIQHKGLDRELYSGPDYFRVPGYPVFLAAIYSVTGYSTNAAIWVQIFISALTCIVVFLIARQLGSKIFALLATGLLIFDLKAGVNAGQITSEIFFTFLLVLCLYSVVLMWQKKGKWPVIFAVVIFALMALTRPVGLHIAILLFLVTAVLKRDKVSLFKAAMPLLAVVIAINSWSYRNYQNSGIWAPTSNAAITLGIHFPAIIWAHVNDSDKREGQIEILRRNAEKYPEYKQLYLEAIDHPVADYPWISGYVHDIKFATQLKPIGVSYLMEHWPQTLHTMITGGFWTLFSGVNEWRNWVISNEEYDAFRKNVPILKKELSRGEFSKSLTSAYNVLNSIPTFALTIFIFMGVHHLIMLLMALYALPNIIYHRKDIIGTIIFIWIAYLMATAGVSGNSRYIAPALPMFNLAAAYGVLLLLQKFSKYKNSDLLEIKN